jgi:hypothetical protein
VFLIETNLNKIWQFHELDKSERVCVLEERLGDIAQKEKAKCLHISALLSVQGKHSEFRIAAVTQIFSLFLDD